jgi:signal transduction histidine kinase
MPTENYQIVAGIVIGIIVLLIATTFIFLLVTFSNNRKKSYIQEKQSLQMIFNEQLLQSQLEIQEHTFNAISKEIHDNVGQVLSLAKVQVNIMEQGETLDRSMLTDLKESISKAMLDLRDIARSLNSDRVRLNSLVEMTNHELQRINRLGVIQAFLFVEGKEEFIEEQKKLIIFRILQESLQNILKHAKAKKVEVFYKYFADHLKLDIVDNGVGFNQEQVNKKDGLGLQNIFSRATLIGGQASIHSLINEGTSVTITLPYA